MCVCMRVCAFKKKYLICSLYLEEICERTSLYIKNIIFVFFSLVLFYAKLKEKKLSSAMKRPFCDMK